MSSQYFITDDLLKTYFLSVAEKSGVSYSYPLQPVSISHHARDSMQGLGVSTELIVHLVAHLGSKEMNYGNTYQKSQYFDAFYYNSTDNTITGASNIGGIRLMYGLGGDCVTLNFELYSKLLTTDIPKQIKEQTGLSVTLDPYEGTARTHFIAYPEYVHRFLVLEIGSEQYLLDACFGELSMFHESGYLLHRLLEYNDIYKTPLPGISSFVGQSGYDTHDNFNVLAAGQMSTLGILDTGTLVVNYSFTKDISSNTVFPMLNSLTPDGQTIHSFTDSVTGESIHIIPPAVSMTTAEKRELEKIIQNLVDVPLRWTK